MYCNRLILIILFHYIAAIKTASVPHETAITEPKHPSDFNYFLLKTLKNADEDQAYRLIRRNELSATLTASLHFATFETVVRHYKTRIDANQSDCNRIKVEGLTGYLKYILKGNFENSENLPQGEFYHETVLPVYREHLIETARTIISLKKVSLNETFFTGMSKDLDASFKIRLLKDVLASVIDSDISSKGYSLFLQAFLKDCPECLECAEMSQIHKTEPFDRFALVFYLAPLHLILLGRVTDTEKIDSLLLGIADDAGNENLIESDRFKAIRHLGSLIKMTKFITKHRIQNRVLNLHILNWISRLFFPSISMYEILIELIRLKQTEIFESFFTFSEKLTLSVTQVGLLITESLRHTLQQMTTDLDKFSRNRSHQFSEKFDFILVILAYFPLRTVSLPKKAVPEAHPHALEVALAIVNHLTTITSSLTIPRTRIGMIVPKDGDKVIRIKEPDPVILSPVLADIYYRFPVYYYAARVILMRIFNIPIVATRVPDSTNDMAEWREAVHFMNFYLERYAALENLSERYEIVSIDRT